MTTPQPPQEEPQQRRPGRGYGDGPLGIWWMTDRDIALREQPSRVGFTGWGLPGSLGAGPGVPTTPAGGTQEPEPGNDPWPLPAPLRLPDE